MENEKLWKCEECGMHYRTEAKMLECADWCKRTNSCNIEIIKFAVENEK